MFTCAHMCTGMCMYACGNRVNECRGGSWGHVYSAAAHRRRTQDLEESILSSHHVSHYQSPDMSFLFAMRQDNLLYCRILAMMFCLTTA